MNSTVLEALAWSGVTQLRERPMSENERNPYPLIVWEGRTRRERAGLVVMLAFFAWLAAVLFGAAIVLTDFLVAHG